MKERPIIMSAESVRAILAGQKTQTRRVVKLTDAGRLKEPGGHRNWHPADPEAALACLFGQPGTKLWVRETWCPVNDTEYGGEKWIDYRATPYDSAEQPAGWQNAPDSPDALKWRSPIHMPRWASRLTLEIVSVRVERLQAITVDDVVAEGINLEGAHAQDFIDAEHAQSAGLNIGCRYPEIYPFVRLWDSINGKRPGCAWQDNPWVWRIEFAQVTP